MAIDAKGRGGDVRLFGFFASDGTLYQLFCEMKDSKNNREE